MSDEHVLRCYHSGSFTEENGGRVEFEITDCRTEVFVEAECSCGEKFNNYEEAYQHIEEAGDE